jgi:hypothetical protein
LLKIIKVIFQEMATEFSNILMVQFIQAIGSKIKSHSRLIFQINFDSFFLII